MPDFGYGIGDFIAVYQLVKDLRSRFLKAPEQFRAISDDVEQLWNILQEVGKAVDQYGLDSQKQAMLQGILNGFHEDLVKLQKALEKQKDDFEGTSHTVVERARKAWRRVRWDQTEITEFRSHITMGVDSLNLFLNSHVLVAIREHINQSNQASREQREDILNWLTPNSHAALQNEFFARRKEGTGQWLLLRPEFQEWVDNKEGRLFCPGMPGAGKTILTSIIIDYLERKFSGNANVGIAYLYCSFHSRQEKGIHDLLSHLLKQLVQSQQHIPDNVKGLWERHRMRQSRPSFDELLKEIQTVSAWNSRVFIIIDALDEYKGSGGNCARLLSALSRLQNNSGVNILITSRHLPDIEFLVGDCPRVQICAHSEDVERYLDERMMHLNLIVKADAALRDEIKTTIVKAVDGMFLLAQLYMDSLQGMTTKKKIRGHLQTAMKDTTELNKNKSKVLDKVYMQAMERISAQDEDLKDLAMKVLAWITCAKRPLTSLELQTAVAIELESSEFDSQNMADIEDMVSVCAGLVTIDQATHVTRLVHYTTQEFLDRTWASWFPQAQENIVRACITYLSFDAFGTGRCETVAEVEARTSLYPFYEYAAQSWGLHAISTLDQTQPLIMNFLTDEARASSSGQAITALKSHLSSPTNNLNGIHLAVYFGLVQVTEALIARGYHPDSKSGYDRTPLAIASERGHDSLVKILLATNQVDLESKSGLGQTPLSLAARFGHQSIVNLLIGAGHNNVNSRSTSGMTPLLWAVVNGHETVVRLLVAIEGIDTNAQDNEYGRTPLCWAVAIGHQAIAELLLTVDSVDPDAKDEKYHRTALSWAAETGQERMVNLLFNTNRVSLETHSLSGLYPLSWAARNGHFSIVKMLLEKNSAHINCQDNQGWAPLLWSAERKYKTMMQLLLQCNDIKVNICNGSGRTPISLAAANGHMDLVELLLDHPDIDPDIPDCHGNTALWHSVSNGCQKIFELLLQRDDVNPQPRRKGHSTPLIEAAYKGHVSMIALLLQRNDVNPDSQNIIDGTAISLAAGHGKPAALQLLLESGRADPNIPDTFGRTPLSWAAAGGQKETSEILLRHSTIRPDLPDKQGRTPLSFAAGNGHTEIVELFLGNGLNRDLQDNRGWTPFLWAANGGHIAVVQLFLSHNSTPSQELTTPTSNIADPDQLQVREGVNVTYNASDFYWTCAVETARRIFVTQQEAGRCYMVSPPIADQHAAEDHPVRNIIFTITSRDQGWSDNTEHHGTRDHSYTWFEAVAGGESENDLTGGTSRRVFCNVHAGREFQTHTVTWTFDAEDEGERMWVRSLQRGQRVYLTVWAAFPGWCNHVASAKMEIVTASIG